MGAGIKHWSRKVLGCRPLFQVFFKKKVRYTKTIDILLYHRLLHFDFFEFKSALLIRIPILAASMRESINGENVMAGHSKWANIQHRKGRQDERRGKVFTRLIKEITVAARLGDSDPASNPRLRLAMEKAYDQNMPKDNVERAIKRGSGELDGVDYIELRYEGYGINGAAVMVNCMTDNKTRTVADVRHAFTKYGGNLGTDGSVSFLFKHCGQMIFAPGTDENALMEVVLDAGAEDVVSNNDGSIEVITAPNDFIEVKQRLEATGFRPEMAEIIMKPIAEVLFTGDDAVRMQKLLDALENLDDVQEVYTTAVIAE
ncbi:putative transcriptional regulatory protein DID90_2727554588 [Candidatus Nitrotoga arctica]|uniref:Probable transcriptional regulatory protein NTG6680_2244 n=2 Tax=Candidatus Nitrotoga arctica TaxID=453162 RepID=A0ABN8AL55_9PROT|nr:putative transcriptional regulatory protein DID90_2727554588 [Candidatus Nitrotoga arctica]